MDDKICWVSQQKAWQPAEPFLRTCYTSTKRSCCNYIEDAEIGSFHGDVIPSACSGSAPD